MKNWRAWIFCLGFFAVVVWTVGGSQSFQSCIEKEKNAPADHDLQKSISKFLFLSGPYRNCLGDFTHENAEAIIGGFTMVLAFFTIFLWGATRDLVEGGENIGKRQQRAFVYNSHQHWKGFKRVGSPWLVDCGWVFTFEWRNNGPTQARRLTNHVSWEHFDKFEGDLPSSFGFANIGQEISEPIFIAPQNSIVSDGCWIDSNVLKAVQDGHIRLFMWGWVQYQDIFDEEHETQFCFELNRVDGDPYAIPVRQDQSPSISFNFRHCRRHNCADEDCNKG